MKTTNPLPFERSYWVTDNLLAGEIPAAVTDEATQLKLTGLIGSKVDAVINLMEAGETNWKGQPFNDYTGFLNQNKVETYRLSIQDVSVPTKERMQEILDLIDSLHAANKKVYVHCWGGIGRTGTVVGCYLLRHGLATKENVFDTIDHLKRNTSIAGKMSPETTEQKNFVLNWN
ncbi:dual specificity protein phosphatase family protein [Telluribacter sp. SYSU D00476]|uniref:protein-tyrosine phosphatase family protein n=1 Tax=Telluribacter sp. SYSU D00476 TaxID=2811430 RepID=UPI001FF3B1BA|nr:dual specificity protein phosphatase family protein [Telluribacter sp. SYSU D00476]